MTPAQVARFWSKVSKTEGCWSWGGTRSSGGYGWFGCDGRMNKAHRVAYELARGPIAPGLFVCHRCDNRLCVHPDHLWLGTPADNMSDMVAKGRQARRRGERVNGAKLTEAQVLECFRRRRAGETHQAIARSMGVIRQTVTLILSGKTWAHVSPLAEPGTGVAGG